MDCGGITKSLVILAIAQNPYSAATAFSRYRHALQNFTHQTFPPNCNLMTDAAYLPTNLR
jgi:hypothetical protein